MASIRIPQRVSLNPFSRLELPLAIRVPIGMSDVIILIGSRRQADRAVRRVLADRQPYVRQDQTGRGFGERRKA